MPVEMLTNAQEANLATTLKELYFLSVVEDQFHDDSNLFHDIESLVNQSIKYQNEAIVSAGTSSLRFTSTGELANAFWVKYKKCIIETEKLAYIINKRFGYSIDLASVIAPYFLYQAGVTDEKLSFYISLGLVVAKIICDSIASKKEAIEKSMDEESMRIILIGLRRMLISSNNTADDKDQEVISKAIEEIGKIINV